MEQALSQVFSEFAANPVIGGKAMRRLLESDPASFLQSSLPVLRAAPATQSFSYLLTLLLMNDLILEQLTDPVLFSFDEAVHLAKRMLRIEPLLDIKMVRTLLDTKDLSSREELEKKADTDRGLRLLEIMAAISDGARILPVMAQLLHHPSSRVRSKAALLVGRSNKNYQWVEQRMAEPDARVRANALESLWGVDSDGARQVLWSATSDADNRVAGNALHGLYQLGDAACIPPLLAMLNHAQDDFRTSAVWVIGETGDPRFLPILAALLSDPESRIRAAVFRAIAKLKQSMAHLSEGQLRIHIGQAVLLTGGLRQLRVSVSAPDSPAEGQPLLGGLKATQFVLHHGTNLITDYESLEENRSEGLCVAFALPRVVDTNDSLHLSLQDCFSSALAHKRKTDAWVTLRYQCDPVRAKAVAPTRSTKTILQIEQTPVEPEPLMVPPDLHFSTEPQVILGAISSPGSRMSAAPNMIQAGQILLPLVATARGVRHIIFVHHPLGGKINPGDSQELVRAARAAKIALHGIVSEPTPGLAELCAKTGGFLLQASEEVTVAQAFENLCANLASHYRLRFRLPGPDSQATITVKVQANTEEGSGEQAVCIRG